MLEKRRTTGIEWTDHTWNPFVGCSIKSAGCQNCYAMALAGRLDAMGNETYSGLTKKVGGKTIWTGKIRANSKSVLLKPDSIKPPSIFFVNSMSDFFHDNASDDLRTMALDIMEALPRHTFQILTKRPENVTPYFKRIKRRPASNIWLGATVEDARVEKRIDIVKDYPSDIKFLSIEPLIAPMGRQNYRGIEWVITGGESGWNARPCDPDWLRVIRDDLIKYDVPHFFKQWGAARNNPLFHKAPAGISPSAWVEKNDPVGKGGSKLDGKYFKKMPKGFKVADLFD